MFLEKVKSEGLAHLSYIAATAARLRSSTRGATARSMSTWRGAEGARITHIFETHRNEDYVIRATTSPRYPGQSVYHGAELPFAYGSAVDEGDAFDLGDVRLTVLKTPGHTFESISLVLADTAASRRRGREYSRAMRFSSGTWGGRIFSRTGRGRSRGFSTKAYSANSYLWATR